MSTPLIARSIQAALEDNVIRLEGAVRTATNEQDTKAAAYWQAELNAANKALYHYTKRNPVQPVKTTIGWLVPSAERTGVIYRVSSVGCTCPAGEKGAVCWHVALCNGHDHGIDSVEMVDTYSDNDRERDLAGLVELYN
jgi:hypothetical protein